MDITWQAHNAVISDRLRQRASAALQKLQRRLNRAVRATVRFEREETRCRVEVMLTAARHRALIAEGKGRYYGPALAMALGHLETQVGSEHDVNKARKKGPRRARP